MPEDTKKTNIRAINIKIGSEKFPMAKNIAGTKKRFEE